LTSCSYDVEAAVVCGMSYYVDVVDCSCERRGSENFESFHMADFAPIPFNHLIPDPQIAAD
jgi:hypothetical protein